MDVRIFVETAFENGTKRTHRIGRLSRPYRLTRSEGFGLLLEDAKAILGQLQGAILSDQIDEISEASRVCPDCKRARAIHDYRSRVLDTLFGQFQVKAPRLRRCACDAKSDFVLGGPISPMAYFFPGRATPELQRVHADLGSRHSFREAARLMRTFLPCRPQPHTTVRNRLGKIATNLESGGCKNSDCNNEGRGKSVTVFLDGAHIRCLPEYQKRHLDVVVGKIEGHKDSQRFGLVTSAGPSPHQHIRRALASAGWKPGRKLTVFSDGEPGLPKLIRDAVGQPVRHILDRWHISMRVRHIETALQGLIQVSDLPCNPKELTSLAERIRRRIWHGTPHQAISDIHELTILCARLRGFGPGKLRSKAIGVQNRCHFLHSYLSNNLNSLVNYGSRYSRGLPVSTSRAEGCVDDIANTRMGKRRRMRWSPKGAHRVAVTRAAVLDGRLKISHRKIAA